MSVFATVVSGVTVFVVGQVLLKLVIEPIQKLREAIAEVAFYLANDHAVIHNAETVEKEVAQAAYSNLRQLGARLVSNRQLIPSYPYLRKLFSLPDSANIQEASQKLFQISNHMYGNDPEKYYRLDLYRIEVCELLRLQDPINNGMSKQELIDGLQELRRKPNA
ncbi:MAG: hypothetical protein NDI67_16375 [Sulfuritalea sp.]|nr:hypothetical protein [Sulfuritalea sp.]